MSITTMEPILLNAVQKNDQRQLEAILNTGFHIDSAFADTTLLTEAICCGNRDLVHKLLQAGADVNIGNKQFVTPLSAAAAKNDIVLLELLLDFNCDISKLSDKRPVYQIRTPLHYAISHGNITMARRLLEKGHCVNFPTLGDLRPMHDAIISDSPGMLSLIVNHPEFNASPENDFWKAPLYQALFMTNKLHIAKVLLESEKFSLFHHIEGHSLLEILMSMAPYVPRKSATTKLLISAGCDVLHRDRSVYEAWLESATIIGGILERMPIIMLLIEAGLRPTFKELIQLYRLCSKKEEEEQCEMIRNICAYPQSLEKLCQQKLRNCLGVYSSRKADLLPLPKILSNFVAYRN